MLTGIYTALITPMTADGQIDEPGLERLIEFQLTSSIAGLVPAGTTGESPTLSDQERQRGIECSCRLAGSQVSVIAGAGSNSTSHTLAACAGAARAGARGVLLVDPYYNGPSSLEIRCEYIAPVARRFPDLEIIPYVVPARTGTQLDPVDLALLATQFANVRTVKEASPNSLKNAAVTRRLCGDDFAILSGDDAANLPLMRDPEIAASGAISVVANIAPGAVSSMAEAALSGNWSEADRLHRALEPLARIVHVETIEQTPLGTVPCRARSPLPIKTLMQFLGMPAGPCRPPLGRMTRSGVEVLRVAARGILRDDPFILDPIAAHFGVDLAARLDDDELAASLSYTGYGEAVS